MYDKVKKIHLSIDKQLEYQDEIDYHDTYTDVIVELINQEKYIASFFTYKNLEAQVRQHKETGAFMQGKYFWVNKMLFIENIELETIELVIEDLIEEGNFELVFKRI